ncbi:FixH family protein [Neptunitalea lumnitzerae]|nr:FixH family protein [Neptunitalea sp. Y10]
MKFNWGTGVFLAFVAFMSFILYFVISTLTDSDLNYDLVTDDYYKKELGYQKEINALTRAKVLGMQVQFEETTEGVVLTFPEKIDFTKVKGTMFLYRPSDKHLDFEIPISLSDSHLLIPNNRLKDGRWDINVEWTYNGETFLSKKEISL